MPGGSVVALVGRSGADVVQVADSVKEIVSANDLGYLFANAVA